MTKEQCAEKRNDRNVTEGSNKENVRGICESQLRKKKRKRKEGIRKKKKII